MIRIKDRRIYKIASLKDEVPRCYFRMLFCPGKGEGTQNNASRKSSAIRKQMTFIFRSLLAQEYHNTTAATTIFFNTAAWKEFYRVASLRKRELFYAGNSRCLSTPRRLAVSKNGSGTIHAICHANCRTKGKDIQMRTAAQRRIHHSGNAGKPTEREKEKRYFLAARGGGTIKNKKGSLPLGRGLLQANRKRKRK